MDENACTKKEQPMIMQSMQEDLKKATAIYLDSLMGYSIELQNLSVCAVIQELTEERRRKIGNANRIKEENAEGIELLFANIPKVL